MWRLFKTNNKEKYFAENKELDAEVCFISVSHKYLHMNISISLGREWPGPNGTDVKGFEEEWQLQWLARKVLCSLSYSVGGCSMIWLEAGE